MRLNVNWAYSLCALVIGCNTLDEPTACNGCDGDGQTRVRRVVPTDTRQAITQSVRPPPISGGTLLVTQSAIVAADPDRDRVLIVDPSSFLVRFTLPLQAGDEPGRVAAGKEGQVYVALRGSGNVLTIDTALGIIVARTPVCGAPRGLAFDAKNSKLLVACAEGSLVELDGGTVVRRTALGADLRDVVINGESVYVSRFRSAAILKLDSARNIVSETRPPTVIVQTAGDRTAPNEALASVTASFEPEVAWRMLPNADGVVVVHQRATTAVVNIEPSSEIDPSDSPYGSGGGCDGIVRPAVTLVDSRGAARTTDGILGAMLPVDVAVFGGWIAIANAGARDTEAPMQSVVIESSDGATGGGSAGAPAFGGVTTLQQPEFLVTSERTVAGNQSCAFPVTRGTNAPAIAVAFDSSGRLFAQTREPSTLVMFPNDSSSIPTVLALGGDSRLDTGHELFHRDGGAGIACASCHPEGGEDGRVWHFDVSGDRRTQPLNVGLADTAPFHWDGQLEDVGELMKDVFVDRMNGVFQSQPRIDAISSYLFGFRPPTPVRPAGDPAAERGRLLFESAEVGCSSCHSGQKLTNNRSVEIGKGQALQVPSLVGISRRAPYLHDGCAATLAERFDPSCGGSLHGDVSQLAADGFGDLIAYLETL